MEKISLHSQDILCISLSPRELKDLNAKEINELIQRSSSEIIFVHTNSKDTDALIGKALQYACTKSFSGMLLIGRGGLPLFFLRESWQLVGGFHDEQGERIFTDFINRGRELRRFNVIQVG